MTSPDDHDGLIEKHTKSFLGHLQDLRKTVLWCVSAIVIGMMIAIPFAPWIRRLIRYPLVLANLGEAEPRLEVLHATGGIEMAARIVFWSGLILAIPIVVIALAMFIFPGLTRLERRAILNSAGFAVVLFAGGVLMGYYMTLPVALRFLITVNGWMGTICETWQEPMYITFVLRVLLVFGLAFELPVIVLALGSVGIVSSQQLREKRRHVVVGLLIMAMFLTPADPYTMILMAVPLIGLYEICIWWIWAKERAKAKVEG